MRFLLDAPIPILIEFALLISTAICGRTRCPRNTRWIDDGFCLSIERAPISFVRWRHPVESQDIASEACKKLKVGGLSWHLPKVDTNAKRDNIADAIVKFASKQKMSFSLEKTLNANVIERPFIWLGLRRRRPWSEDQGQVTDESFWYWTVDNSPLNLWVESLDMFWAHGQPDNGAESYNESEECAAAFLFLNEAGENRVQFHDMPCNTSKEHVKQGLAPKNLIGMACTAQVDIEPGPITDEWWFVVICVVAVVVPIALVAVGFAVFYKKRSRRRRGIKSKRGTTRSFRSRRSRRSGRKTKKRERRVHDQDEDGYESYGNGADRSCTLDSVSEEEVPVKLFKFGFTKSTIAKSTPTGVAPPKTSTSIFDDDKHEYSNVLPPEKPPAAKMPIAKPKKAMAKAGTKAKLFDHPVVHS